MDKLTIFYDGQCPLCCAEMQRLQQLDQKQLITLVDLHQADLQQHYPGINKDAAMRILHGHYQGAYLFGLEVTHRAWHLVGRGFWVAPLNWPVIKPISGLIYRLFAKYRQPISRFFSPFLKNKVNCSNGVCYGKKSGTDHWRK